MIISQKVIKDYILLHFIRCYACDYKKVLLKYHYGSLPNNKDEYCTGICSKCDTFITWEPNYNVYEQEDHSCIKRNNIFVGVNILKDIVIKIKNR